jgi:hypothetical protein
LWDAGFIAVVRYNFPEPVGIVAFVRQNRRRRKHVSQLESDCAGMGFGSALALAAARGQITPPHFHEISIYNAEHDHAADVALVMVFRKN